MTIVLAIAGGLALWALLARQIFHAETRPAEIHYATARDGWRLALAHYPAAAGGAGKFPVICCHGLGANSLCWDLATERSFARHLAAAGWDVWVVDLRGHGRSERPRLAGGRGFDWTVETFVEHDIPTFIDFVTRTTGRPKLHWVGVSMGGILGYAWLCRHAGDEAVLAQLASVVPIAGILDGTGARSDFDLLKHFRRIAWMSPSLPLRAIHALQAPLVGRVPNRIERFMAHPDNVVPDDLRRLYAHGFEAEATRLLVQMGTIFDSGGLTAADGSRRRYAEALPLVTTPVFAIGGDDDRQCPAGAVESTWTRLGSPRKRLLIAGRAGGHEHPYGHVDLVIGRNVTREVLPEITRWFVEVEAES